MRRPIAISLLFAATFLTACAAGNDYPISGQSISATDPVLTIDAPYGVTY